jgi:hypothetical protein
MALLHIHYLSQQCSEWLPSTILMSDATFLHLEQIKMTVSFRFDTVTHTTHSEIISAAAIQVHFSSKLKNKNINLNILRTPGQSA